MNLPALLSNTLFRIALCLLAVLAMGYYFSPSPSAPGPDASVASQMPASKPIEHPALMASTPGATASAPAVRRTFDENLCKEMTAPASGDPALAQQKFQEAQKQAAQVSEKLIEQAIGSSDPQQRVAALLMQAEVNTRKIPQGYKDKYPDCVNNPSCLQQMEAATTAARTQNFNEIAKMAISSRDPQLYATAMHACNSLDLAAQRVKSAEGFCQQISASQWALRDPDNGMAWLYAAQQVDIKENELDAAMLHLTQVRFFNQRLTGLPQLRENFTLAQQNGFVQLELGTLNNGVFRFRTAPSYKALLDYCHAENIRNSSSRRQVCEGIAQKLLLDDTNTGSAPIGASIGSQLGWPPEKLDKITLEQHAHIGLFMTRTIAGDDAIARNPNKILQHCQDTMREAKTTFDTMEFGEMAGVRKLLASQSLSKTELATKFREQFLKDQPKNNAGEKK